MSDNKILLGGGLVGSAAMTHEANQPHTFRFAEYPDGRRILQGGYARYSSQGSDVIWRDMPVVPVDENGDAVRG